MFFTRLDQFSERHSKIIENITRQNDRSLLASIRKMALNNFAKHADLGMEPKPTRAIGAHLRPLARTVGSCRSPQQGLGSLGPRPHPQAGGAPCQKALCKVQMRDTNIQRSVDLPEECHCI